MPLFSRKDATLVKTTSRVRRMIPYLMKGRNESIVYHEQLVDLTETLPFIEEWNRTHDKPITVFHVAMAGIAKGLIARPGLNRFISGGNTWQRNKVELSFAAKKQVSKDYSPLVTVKLDGIPDEPFSETVRRLHESVGEARDTKLKPVDKEVKLLLKLPGFVLRLIMWLARSLDDWNLFPYAMIKNDPLFASIFVANLGSVGIDRTWHHLYEYGNIGLFCVLNAVCKEVVADENDQPVVKNMVRMRFAFDERINDGHYCAASLAIMRDYVEHPRRFLEEETARTDVAASIAEDARRAAEAFEYERAADEADAKRKAG
ncbi:MAG: hypothetical protein AMXMBFR64_20840 [Myxococcales bacterium]